MIEEAAKLDPGRFHPAPLPRWELKLSFAVWIAHSLGAFYLAYLACMGTLRLWFSDDLHRSPYIRGWLVDPTDTEWHNFMRNLRNTLVAHAAHSVIFHLTYRFLSADRARLVQIVAGFALHAWITSFTCMFVLAAFALVTIGLSVHFRREFIAWILCVGFIIKAFEIAPLSTDDYVHYREFNMYLYGALKIITVCTAFCRNPERQVSIDWALSIAHYMTYLPYAMTIIILYEEFNAQIEQRTSEKRETPFGWRSNLLFSLRLLLSTTLYTVLLHLIPAGAMFASQAATSSRLNGYQMFSLAYVIGQYFHVKYVVLFGVSSLFARIDGMTPPPPPICISRVSRYSRMWRHFDAGLYSFLKNQVYIPLLTNPYLKSGMARPLALVSAFLIVVAWHGSHRNCVVWVCLSALELVIERVGVLIWDSQRFPEFRAHIGEVWLRRLLACCMNLTVAPGILGVFYFLGGEEFGDALIERVLFNGLLGIFKLDFTVVNGVPSSGLVLAHLLTLGYFFNQTCLELEFANRKVPEKNNNNKDNNNDNNNIKEKLS